VVRTEVGARSQLPHAWRVSSSVNRLSPKNMIWLAAGAGCSTPSSACRTLAGGVETRSDFASL
jgi:hypothetical protein